MMKGVRVYSKGVVHCSACVPAAWSPTKVEEEVNRENPTGIEAPWKISFDATFASGQPNPCPCETVPGRLHYLMVC